MTTLKRSIRSGLLFLTLALGAACAGEPVLTIDERVECPVGLIEKVKAEARKQRPEAISKIWIGELLHPRGPYGARIEYEPERHDTYAIAKTLIAHIPGESFRKYYPRFKIEGYGYRLRDEPFTEAHIQTEILRVFPLKQTTLLLRLEDDITYKQVLALLQAIENGTLKQPGVKRKIEKLPGGGWRSTSEGRDMTNLVDAESPSPSDLPNIGSVQKRKDGFEISIRGAYSSTRFYTLQEKDGVYIVVKPAGSVW